MSADELRASDAARPVVHRTRVDDGSVAVTLDNSLIGVEIWPERGAKVRSIVDRRTGRNWLSTTTRPWGDDTTVHWEDSDLAGWDECLPNIASGFHPTAHVDLPDHGEVWSRPWTYDFTARGITMRIEGDVLPYTFARDIELADDTLLVTYRLENRSDDELVVCWAMHLLANIPFSAVQLADETPVRVDSAFGACEEIGTAQDWTTWGDIAARLATVQPGWACKIFTRPGTVTRVNSVDKNGQLSVSMGGHSEPPTFGLWLNAGGWPADEPVHHVGIEAGFGDHDDLGKARESKTTLVVQSRQTATWSISLLVTPATA